MTQTTLSGFHVSNRDTFHTAGRTSSYQTRNFSVTSKLRRTSEDAIVDILDYRLPDMSGREVLKQLRAIKFSSQSSS